MSRIMNTKRPPNPPRRRVSKVPFHRENNRSSSAMLYLGLVLAGVGLLAYGFKELSITRKNENKPTPVTVKELMEGDFEDGKYLRLDDHLRIYPTACYLYYEEGFGSRKQTTDSEIASLYYPILPVSHPLSRHYEEVEKKYKSVENSPDEAFDQAPGFDGYLVLVKTDEFSRVYNIPSNLATANSVEGVLVRHTEWDRDEKELIMEAYPGINQSKILILEKGRKPSSPVVAYMVVTGGFLLLLLPIGLIWTNRRTRQNTVPLRRTSPVRPGIAGKGRRV